MKKSPLHLRYLALKQQERQLADRWLKFHATAKAGPCQHEITREQKTCDDNGYGRWWTTFATVCVFCEKVLEKHTEDGCL